MFSVKWNKGWMHKLLLHSETFYLCKWQGDYPTLHPSALPDCIHISRPWGLKGGGRWTIRNEKHQCHSWPTLRYHSHMGVLGSSVKTVRNARVMQHQSRKHQSSCKTSSKHSRFLDVFIIICNFSETFNFEQRDELKILQLAEWLLSLQIFK